eukprot:6188505-Pleurochrysis_carterae.AAC.1
MDMTAWVCARPSASPPASNAFLTNLNSVAVELVQNLADELRHGKRASHHARTLAREWLRARAWPSGEKANRSVPPACKLVFCNVGLHSSRACSKSQFRLDVSLPWSTCPLILLCREQSSTLRSITETGCERRDRLGTRAPQGLRARAAQFATESCVE